VRAMLRIKSLHDQVQALNTGLEAKVKAQVEELERVGRLRRFLAPQLAQAIVSSGDEKMLENHRREIVAMFCDLRGFTGFAETADGQVLASGRLASMVEHLVAIEDLGERELKGMSRPAAVANLVALKEEAAAAAQ